MKKIKSENTKKYRSHGMKKTKQDLQGWIDFAYFSIGLLETAVRFCDFVEDVVEKRK